MASLPSFTQFCSLHRWQSNLPSLSSINIVQFPDVRLRSTYVVTAVRRKNVAENPSDGEEDDLEKKTTRKRAPTRRRKKAELEVSEESPIVESSISNMVEETSLPSESAKPEKPQRRTRKKERAVAFTSSSLDEEPEKKVTRRRRTKKKMEETIYEGNETELREPEEDTDNEKDLELDAIDGDDIEEPEKKVTRRRRTKKKIEETICEGNETELSEPEEDTDNEKDLELDAVDRDDISFTYAWPPLVCCFGPIQHAFVPSGRQANRLIDHESHERMKDALWTPEKFVRAPGGCAADVALCLARFGSNAAVMGKIGDDDFGQALLYHLNESRVQTRSVRIDPKRTTAVSRMKMSKRGSLKMTSITPCAEDGLKKSEINIDVLKEAKFFYFNSFSLLDRKTRTSALQAIKISKQFGGVIFFDVNLSLPLWHSREETLSIIQEALELADIIEITKQELEFLCGIEPSERFDTKDNDRSKFVHYDPDVIAPVLHDNLELLFVTNGTSKIHYYTKTHNGSVLGTEDVPITPFTSDMSASGNGIVAGLMSKLIVQPHLMTDKEYLVHSINYAINRGVSEQWMQARTLGYPPKPGMEDDEFFPDPNGFKTITEKAYRTLFPIESDDSEDVNITINRHDGDDSEEDEDVNVERHDDYDSEDIGDMELDDEEPVRKVTSAIGA